jgi:hypothetical protein
MTYWHGGPRIQGDVILPGNVPGYKRFMLPANLPVSRSGDVGVFITTDRSLAETYASTVTGSAWVYEVEPLSEPLPIPSLVGGPTISYSCSRARIVRRFTVSNAVRAANRAAVMSTGWRP